VAILAAAFTHTLNADFDSFITANSLLVPSNMQEAASDPGKDGLPSIVEYLVGDIDSIFDSIEFADGQIRVTCTPQ